MKKSYFRKVTAFLTISLFLIHSFGVMGQTTSSPIPGIPPSTGEYAASPGPNVAFRNVQHTGTDALSYNNDANRSDPLNGNTMQVMTWDEGDKVYLSWDFFEDNNFAISPNVPLSGVSSPPAKGSLPPITTTTGSEGGPDPDVVLAYHNNPATGQNDLYANLVYISGGQIQYEVYIWDAGGRTFRIKNGYPVQLGDNRYIHSYPNIDANANGLVAITWQQTITDHVVVSVTSVSSYFLPFITPPIEVTFGRSVLAAGDVTGDLRPCYRDGSGNYGVYVRNPPQGLLEQTLNPDVAISEGDESNAVISSVYVRHFVNGTGRFSIVNELDVVQTNYNRCQGDFEPTGQPFTLLQSDYKTWPYSDGDVIGTPRIAATSLARTYQYNGKDYGTDVEVAIDRTVKTCGAPRFNIWNFGKSEGTFRPTYTLISQKDDPNLIGSSEPAIAFTWAQPIRGGLYNTSYTISWTGGPGYQNGPNYQNGRGNDVWAVTLFEGIHIGTGASGPTAQPSQYSRVNDHADGDQGVASIAGRHLTGNTVARADEPTNYNPDAIPGPLGVTPGGNPLVHLWFDDADKHQVSYRRSGESAGTTTPLRPAPAPLQAYPNPSGGDVGLRLELQKGEKLRSLRVYDAAGRPVADLTRTASPSGEANWQPASGLPAGVYTLRAETSQRRTSASIIRK